MNYRELLSAIARGQAPPAAEVDEGPPPTKTTPARIVVMTRQTRADIDGPAAARKTSAR